MSSYGGVSFTAVEDGWSEPAMSAVNVRGFPGGNNVAVSLGGRREVKRTVTCVFVNFAAYLSFVLLRGAEASLVIDNWNTADAVLIESNPDPPRADGQVVARAQFVLT
jgi:hypothetical protein